LNPPIELIISAIPVVVLELASLVRLSLVELMASLEELISSLEVILAELDVMAAALDVDMKLN